MSRMEKLKAIGKGGIAGASLGVVLITGVAFFVAPSVAFVELAALLGGVAGGAIVSMNLN